MRIAFFDTKPYDKPSFEKYGEKHPEAEQYLNLIHETDLAFEYLINELKNT